MNYIDSKLRNIYSDIKIVSDNIRLLDDGQVQRIQDIKDLIDIILQTKEKTK